jgi:hypothetical protein
VEEYRPGAKTVDIVANWENIEWVGAIFLGSGGISTECQEGRYSGELGEYRVGSRGDIPRKWRNIEWVGLADIPKKWRNIDRVPRESI